jgi:hypothetical protein
MSPPNRSGTSGHWSPDEMDRLERAITEGARIQLSRRGTEYTVVPRKIDSRGPVETLIGVSATGDEMRFALDEIERFDVLW